MPVSDTHPDYDKFLPRWNQVRDCVEGAPAVKARSGGKSGSLNNSAGTKYLPAPEDATQGRYDAYLTRANYVNFTGHTKEGMLGMVFRKDTTYEIPETLSYLEENATGGGLSLEQLIMDVIGDSTEIGRYGILVDYPEVEESLTQAQVQARGLRAALLPYPAESVINWRTEVVDGVKKLSLVVLREPTQELSDDGFSFKEVIKHRVLRLTDGVYTQELYDKNEELELESIPRKADGSTWSEIPFIFAGAQNNDETIDKAPLYDLSEVNLAHYRNSADYEESSFMVGQPTPVLAGLTKSWADEYQKNGVVFGSRNAVLLPEGGSAELLQAAPNSMPKEGMEMKEQQMIMIGARLIQDSSGIETAEAAKIRFAGQNSKLGVIVKNVEEAIIKCLMWAQEFMGGEQEVTIEINKEFYDKSLDAQQIMAIIQLADRGTLSESDLRDISRKAGLTDKTDDELDAERDTFGFNLESPINNQLQAQTVGEPTVPQTDPAILAILEKLTQQPISGEIMPREPGQEPQSMPSVTIEAPITINIPENAFNIVFPENMVNVTVEPAQVTVEGDNSPSTMINGQVNKDVSFEYDERGLVKVGKLRVVKNEGAE